MAELVLSHERAVIPGFYGTGADGGIRTFTRGGSDVTGAVVARAVGAELYENWTDVSGMLMADPRIVNRSANHCSISYQESPRADLWARQFSMTRQYSLPEAQAFRLTSATQNRPQDPRHYDCLQGPSRDAPPHLITGVAGRKGFASITLEKDRMNAELGFGRKVLSVLEARGSPFEHLPTGIDTLSVFTPGLLSGGTKAQRSSPS